MTGQKERGWLSSCDTVTVSKGLRRDRWEVEETKRDWIEEFANGGVSGALLSGNVHRSAFATSGASLR